PIPPFGDLDDSALPGLRQQRKTVLLQLGRFLDGDGGSEASWLDTSGNLRRNAESFVPQALEVLYLLIPLLVHGPDGLVDGRCVDESVNRYGRIRDLRRRFLVLLQPDSLHRGHPVTFADALVAII